MYSFNAKNSSFMRPKVSMACFTLYSAGWQNALSSWEIVTAIYGLLVVLRKKKGVRELKQKSNKYKQMQKKLQKRPSTNTKPTLSHCQLAAFHIVIKRKKRGCKISSRLGREEIIFFCTKGNRRPAYAHTSHAHNLGGFDNLPRHFAAIIAPSCAVLKDWGTSAISILNPKV